MCICWKACSETSCFISYVDSKPRAGKSTTWTVASPALPGGAIELKKGQSVTIGRRGGGAKVRRRCGAAKEGARHQVAPLQAPPRTRARAHASVTHAIAPGAGCPAGTTRRAPRVRRRSCTGPRAEHRHAHRAAAQPLGPLPAASGLSTGRARASKAARTILGGGGHAQVS